MTNVTIRPLSEVDFAAWWRLRLIALQDHPDAFGEACTDALVTCETAAQERFANSIGGFNRIIGAFIDTGALVGTCAIMRHARDKTRHRMDIWGMYAAPELRGAGTGKRLVEAAIGHARQTDGVLQIHLTVASHNIAAITTYSRIGFTTYGREPRAVRLPDRFVDEDFMVLMLDTTSPQ